MQAANLKLAIQDDLLLVVRSGVLQHTLPAAVCRNPMAINQDVKAIRFNEKVTAEFVANWLQLNQTQVLRVICKHSTTVQSINTSELEELMIPVPPLAKQRELVAAMETARTARRAKLAEADALLAGMDAYLLKILGLMPPDAPRKVYAIRANRLTNALSAERYAALQLEKLLHWDTTVADAVELVEGRTLPSREAPSEDWDWIRIDDLPNRPWQVDALRTVPGREIEGALYLVQENDILLARLGPTILNAKFVLAPKPVRQTVASPEFLVLRCKPDWKPEVALWLLRMKLFRDIMYLRSRGGTPSRYRLDGDDLLSIPFPAARDLPQTELAAEIRRRRERARALRAEAEQGWAQAKRWFEEQLLGPSPNHN